MLNNRTRVAAFPMRRAPRCHLRYRPCPARPRGATGPAVVLFRIRTRARISRRLKSLTCANGVVAAARRRPPASQAARWGQPSTRRSVATTGAQADAAMLPRQLRARAPPIKGSFFLFYHELDMGGSVAAMQWRGSAAVTTVGARPCASTSSRSGAVPTVGARPCASKRAVPVSLDPSSPKVPRTKDEFSWSSCIRPAWAVKRTRQRRCCACCSSMPRRRRLLWCRSTAPRTAGRCASARRPRRRRGPRAQCGRCGAGWSMRAAL